MRHRQPRRSDPVAARARKALLWSIAITLALYFIPYGDYLARPLLHLSTLVHELGHGVAAMLTGGTFHRFVMSWDGSGTAYWSPAGDGGRLASAFVAAGGLCGPAAAAAILLIVARRPFRARLGLFALGLLLLVAEVAVVRSAFGLVFVGALAALCLFLAVSSQAAAQLALVFLSVQLALSVYSRSDYLFAKSAGLDPATGEMLPSDVIHMSEALGLPYWAWGALCGAFSALMLVLGAWSYLRNGAWRPQIRRPRSPEP